MEEDLTCPLCFKVFYIPVSTSCGHTYCKSCIERSFQQNKHCPSCRTTLSSPLNLTPTFVLQSIIEKRFPEETKKRRQEDLSDQRQKRQKSTTLPVIFQKDLIAFPGENFLFLVFEDKYLNMLETLPAENRVFAIVSNFDGKYICWVTELKGIQLTLEGKMVFGKCLARLAPIIVRRVYEPHYSISVQEVTEQQIQDESLFEVPNVVFNDVTVKNNSELERELIGFAEACIGTLTETELLVLRQRAPSGMKPSFFMLTIFKMESKELSECFLTQDDDVRLMVLKKYFEGKTPCRLHIKYCKPASTSMIYGCILIILIALLIVKIKS